MSQAFVGLSVTEVVASSITVVAGNRVAAACQEQQAAWHEMLLRTLFDINLKRYCAIKLTGPGICAGTTMNYFLDDRINNAAVLFPGVGCFLIAACLGSWLHASNVADIDKKLGIQRGGDVIDRYVIRSHPNWPKHLVLRHASVSTLAATAAATGEVLLLTQVQHTPGCDIKPKPACHVLVIA